MHIQKIHIENFRLLKNVDIVLDKSLTLIVGKNNTGKTSIAHLIRTIIKKKKNLLHLFHDDIIKLFAWFLDKPKFRMLLTDRYPIILIDEYQDSFKSI